MVAGNGAALRIDGKRSAQSHGPPQLADGPDCGLTTAIQEREALAGNEAEEVEGGQLGRNDLVPPEAKTKESATVVVLNSD